MEEVIKGLQKKLLMSLRDWLDPAYFVLTVKQNPLSEEEESFLNIYENSACLHIANIVFTFPSMVYYYHYFRASKSKPVNMKKLIWARNRMLFFVPLAFATMTTTYAYEKVNNFHKRLKEI